MSTRLAKCGHPYPSEAIGRTRKKCDACLKQLEPEPPASWWDHYGYAKKWADAYKEQP